MSGVTEDVVTDCLCGAFPPLPHCCYEYKIVNQKKKKVNRKQKSSLIFLCHIHDKGRKRYISLTNFELKKLVYSKILMNFKQASSFPIFMFNWLSQNVFILQSISLLISYKHLLKSRPKKKNVSVLK